MKICFIIDDGDKKNGEATKLYNTYVAIGTMATDSSEIDKKKLQIELIEYDLLVVGAPKAVKNGFFDDIENLDCGIPVLVLRTNTDPEIPLEYFSHVKRLLVRPTQYRHAPEITELTGEWRQEREDKKLAREALLREHIEAGKVIGYGRFTNRPRMRTQPDRSPHKILSFAQGQYLPERRPA